MEGDGEPGGPRLRKRFAGEPRGPRVRKRFARDSGGPRLRQRFAGGKLGGGEADCKTKAGTTRSHNYLNQKPNKRREQTNAHRDRRAGEVAGAEQEFFRQTALLSDKANDKIEMMKAVSFTDMQPPGYNAESAKAAGLADEEKKAARTSAPLPSTAPESEKKKRKHKDVPGCALPMEEDFEVLNNASRPGPVKKKQKHTDVSGRALPMEKDFEVWKNASRTRTGVVRRVKPFALEIRSIKSFKCGNYRHQSGDRERPAKDAIMPNEQSCLGRDGPLMTIQAHTGSSAELKQKPGLSLPHGEFDLDNPNQQILATDDIYEEYGAASKSPNCESYPTMEDLDRNKAMVRSRDPVLSEEQREKCRQWAEEEIGSSYFTGNFLMKLEEEEEERCLLSS